MNGVDLPCLRLLEEVLRSMVEHAEAALPEEAVGLIGAGADGRAVRAVRLHNLASSGYFLADPYSQFRAFKELESEGLVALAVYHSHPGGGVLLSEIDRAFAKQLDLVQVVLALARPWQPGVELRAYRVSGDQVEDLAVLVERR